MITLAQRRDARDAVARPGKFEGEPPMVPILYGITLDGMSDESTTDGVDGGSWLDLIGRWLLYGDSQGFVHGLRHDNADDARAVFDAQSALWDSLAEAEALS